MEHRVTLSRRLVVLLLAGIVLVSAWGLPRAEAEPPTPADRVTALAAAPTTDASMQLPRTRHDEAVGDFGSGYFQRAVYEDNHINVYEPTDRGGGLVRSTPTDLTPVGTMPPYSRQFLATGPSAGIADDNDLNSVYLYWTPDALYLAGMRGDGTPCCANDAGNFIYKVSPRVTCASRDCALADPNGWVKKADLIGSAEGDFDDRLLGITALTVGQVGGARYIAVGMSEAGYFAPSDDQDGGVLIFDDTGLDFWGNYRQPSQWTAFRSKGNDVANITTSLAFDPKGSGLLSVGVISPGRAMNALWFNPAPAAGCRWGICRYTYVDQLTGDDYLPAVLSTAVTNRADGSPIVAFGFSDGSVKLWDPAVTSKTFLASLAGTSTDDDPRAVNALTSVERSDQTTGVPDLVAVSSRGNFAQVLRYSGASTLAPQPVAANSAKSTDVGSIRSWFPGYKTGVMQIRNHLREPVDITFQSRPNAAFGCWFAPAFAAPGPARAAFPVDPVTLGENSLSDFYTVGALTAGPDGGCAATDATGQWAAYLVVTPNRRPADTTTVKIYVSRNGDLTLQTVGGSSVVKAFQAASSVGLPLGQTTIDIAGPPLPAPGPAPRLTGTRLDPADVERPVYRFDVPATTWNLPISTPARIQSVLEPIEVMGLPEVGDPIPLGLLIPQGPPSRATTGAITLAPASFYYQNPAQGTQLRGIALNVGDRLSNPVRLADLPAPTVTDPPGQLVVCPASGSTSCDGRADPMATGLDQAPLRIQVLDGASTVLPLSDPSYGRIYYRDDNGDLLTGLIPADGSAYVRVSPYAGAYPNDGTSGTGTRPPVNAPVGGRFGYLTTNTTTEQEITAHVGGSALASDPITVDAVDFQPEVSTGAEAASGFYVEGCTDYSTTSHCRIATPTAKAPALFLTKDPDSGALRIGLQFSTVGQTSLTSLPLQQVPTLADHTVVATPLLINNGEVHLNSTAGFQPADRIDTYLVTHGAQVTVGAVRVGGGN